MIAGLIFWALVVLFSIHLFRSTRKIKKSLKTVHERNRKAQLVDIDATPDTPASFGYKVSWIAVRSDSTAEVSSCLAIGQASPANWRTGISRAYEDLVFVSPPVANWVFIVPGDLPDLSDVSKVADWTILMSMLSGKFGEAQYYASHRIVSYYAWSKFINGQEIRAYSHFDGETLIDRWPITQEESSLEHIYFDSRCEAAATDRYWERKDLCYPDEGHVLQVAELWSINPIRLDHMALPASIGLAGVFRSKASERVEK